MNRVINKHETPLNPDQSSESITDDQGNVREIYTLSNGIRVAFRGRDEPYPQFAETTSRSLTVDELPRHTIDLAPSHDPDAKLLIANATPKGIIDLAKELDPYNTELDQLRKNFELHTLGDLFLKHQLRLTRPRRQVFGALKLAGTPLLIAEIIKATPSVDKVSVYRIIALFTRLHVATTVTRGWKQSYELAPPFSPHHHHLSCTHCGTLSEIHSEKLEAIITDLAVEYDFEPVGHHFELQGLCAVCKK